MIAIFENLYARAARWYACPICTRLQSDRALCPECAEDLFARREITVRDLGAYQTRGLFAWRRDDWRALRWWATGLKRKEHAVFWREPATWLIDAFGIPAARTVIVPVPSSHRFNHARGFAAELARQTGLEMRDVLVPRSARHQRRLSRDARRARRFDRRDEGAALSRVVVIDDIITSGATAEAAYRALGQPAWCEVWCLMDRRPAGR